LSFCEFSVQFEGDPEERYERSRESSQNHRRRSTTAVDRSSHNFRDITGQVYNGLSVIRLIGKNKHGQTLWEVRCYCGTLFSVVKCSLVSGNTKSCGCLRKSRPNPRFKDLTGMRFGRLIVIARAPGLKRKNALWLCECDCGMQIIANGADLRVGDTKSCGCLQKDWVLKKNTKHGLSHTPEASILNGIIQRCTNPNNTSYKDYGGRGIGIEDLRWFSLEYFVEDMGRRPDGSLSIERLDNNRGYFKENCIWADDTTQIRNRRISISITYNGKTQSLQEWADEIGMNYATLYGRYMKNKPLEEVFSPKLKKNQFR